MAIYHFSGTIISRSQGRSAVACAAYRSAEKLRDERYEKTHDYTHKEDVAFSEIMLPDGAPDRLKDREVLWNEVERSEKRKDAQLAREFNFALPRELTLEQNIALAKEFVNQEFVSKGMIADLCIHNDKMDNGELQPHVHVMLTMRQITEEGFGQKVREWNAKENLLLWREAWANVSNRHLALQGLDLRIDHRSYAEQGIELEPQSKIGAVVVKSQKARFEDHQRIARENGAKILENPKLALEAMTRQQSTFTHQDLARFINRHTDTPEQFQQVYDKVKGVPEIVLLGVDDQQRERFTTQAMLTLETDMLARAERLSQYSKAHDVSEGAKNLALTSKSLSQEQQIAFDHLLKKSDLSCVVGYAGTGKSYLLGAAREAWEAEGYHVHGATLSGIAAQNLEGSSGIESRTLASRCYYWDRGRELLTSQDILVIDEAGMIGSRQMARVLEEADKYGAKVVLLGDPEQLQAIEAGAAFRAISEQVGYVELTEIRRQREVWQQDATREFATGRTEEALARYAAHDHIHVYDSDLRAKQAVIEHWNDARISDPDKTQIMLAYTRKEVFELNSLARDLRRVHGELGEDHTLDTARGQRDFAEHDRIYFLKNERSLDVKNGTLGTLEKIKGDELTIRLDKDDRHPEKEARLVTVRLDQYNHIDHGYAATFHKSQGVTVDRSYLLTSSYMDRHATYMGGSRHRDSCDIFYSKETFANEKALAETLSRERAKDVSLDYGQKSKRFTEITERAEFGAHYGLERGEKPGFERENSQENNNLLDKSFERNTNYHEARERFSQNEEHKQSVLERVEARRDAKALQLEVDRLEHSYQKPANRQLEQGEQGIYRETIDAGKSRYAVIEKEDELKLVPYEKGMERNEGRAVKIGLSYDEKTGRERATLELSREREIGGRSRGDDFDLSL